MIATLLQYVLQAIILLAVAYVAVLVLLYFLQARIIFVTSRDMHRAPDMAGWAYEDVTLDVMGETTHGWYIPLENARGTVLFSHGNAGNIADRLESIELLRRFGLSVLAYDYGGYGRSTGSPSEQRCYADIRAMWHWLTEVQGIPPGKILVFGRSLGAAVSLDLATEVQPAAVIAESAFLSTVDLAREIFWWLPAGYLLQHRFENKHKVPHLTAPLLLIHSPEDEIIGYHHGQELYRLAAEPKRFVEIAGDHNTGFVISGARYQAAWEEFLDEVLPRPHATGSPAP